MASNGASGLQFEIEGEDDGDEEEVDPEVIEEQFRRLCEQQPQLKEMANELSLQQKYQILTQGFDGGDDDDEQEIYEHEGKTYRKVQI